MANRNKLTVVLFSVASCVFLAHGFADAAGMHRFDIHSTGSFAMGAFWAILARAQWKKATARRAS